MEDSRYIIIQDSLGKMIGKLPTATNTDIMNLINKGFVVIDGTTGSPISIDDISNTIGVSECVIG